VAGVNTAVIPSTTILFDILAVGVFYLVNG